MTKARTLCWICSVAMSRKCAHRTRATLCCTSSVSACSTLPRNAHSGIYDVPTCCCSDEFQWMHLISEKAEQAFRPMWGIRNGWKEISNLRLPTWLLCRGYVKQGQAQL